MTTPKTPLTLEHAVFEAMQRPPRGIGPRTVAAILGKSQDALYKATNPYDKSVNIWRLVGLNELMELSATVEASGSPDLILPALILDRNRRADLMRQPDCLDKAHAQLMDAVGDVIRVFAAARDPDSEDGHNISRSEAVDLLSSLSHAREAIEKKCKTLIETISHSERNNEQSD